MQSQKLNRRAMMAGTAATFATVPAIAAAAVDATVSDAKIFKLVSEYYEAWEAVEYAPDDETANRNGEQWSRAYRKLLTAEPQTLVGLCAKIDAFELFYEGCMIECTEELAPIFSDIRRLAGKAVAV